MNNIPAVSIGLPVYNGEEKIREVIEALLSQDFDGFELIISDNCSTDRTEQICREFANKDTRIKYIRQETNIGPEMNFKFVFDQARGEYFMWAAADDMRTPGFIGKCVDILRNKPDYSFASAANCFEGEEEQADKLVNFSLEGSQYDRLRGFVKYCWLSHACFYSLMRREYLLDFADISRSYLAFDWSIDVHLLAKGRFARVIDEKLILGRGGNSSSSNHVASSRTRKIHYLIPFYDFSKSFLNQVWESNELNLAQRFGLLLTIVRFNILYVFWAAREKLTKD
jgi:glycosyltransferase involved in cell wall biosynthesis